MAKVRVSMLALGVMVALPQLAWGKARAWPRAVFHKHLRSVPTEMLRRVAVRQFRDLTWDTRSMTQPKEGLARDYTFLVTTFDPQRGEKYLGDPEALSRQPLLFASVISDLPALHLRRGKWSLGKPKMRTHTVFDLGYVLIARPKNVVVNSSGDTTFAIRKPYPQTLRALREMLYRNYPAAKLRVDSELIDKWPYYRWQRVGPFTPKDILDRTIERNNEVLMHGSYGRSKVRAGALLVRVDPLTHEDRVPADQLAPYLADAREQNIPVVRIPDQRFVHNHWAQPEENARFRELMLQELERSFHGQPPTEDWRNKIWE